MKICKICGRPLKDWEIKKCGFGMCSKHYHQMQKFGKIVDSSSITITDRNSIEIKDNYAEVICLDSKKNINRVKISLEDLGIISQYKWSIMNQGYAITYHPKRQFMHQLLCPTNPKEVVDHINRDKIDNRRENLRAVTKQGNACNSLLINKPNITNIRGLRITKNNKYSACICVNGKYLNSKSYKTIEEAAYARYILTEMFFPVEVPYVKKIWENKLSFNQMKEISDFLYNKFHKFI